MIRVLYIDDDAGLGRLLQRALSPKGFDIVSVQTGSEALRRLASERFDVVALDHDLGSETGLDLIGPIQNTPASPPIVYVTGSDDIRVAVAALKAGAADYVWKDVQGHYRELLQEAIAAAMERAKLQHEREEAHRLMREARDRAEMLLAEVNHRVANSLALVAALAQLQANAVEDEAARTALQKMRARIVAIGGLHRRLYTGEDVRNVELKSYLESLIEELAGAIEGGAGHRIRFTCPSDVSIATDKAISLGVIATELITNAVKYAYPKNRAGEIRVSLEPFGASEFQLAVEDDGVGLSREGPSQGTGVGTRIIRAMASNLQGALAYREKTPGSRVELRFPVQS